MGDFPPLYFHYKWAVITQSAAACKRICPELLIISVQADPVAVPGVTSRTAAVVFVPRGVLGYFAGVLASAPSWQQHTESAVSACDCPAQ